MPRDERKRQQQLQRQAAKRKQKHQVVRQGAALSGFGREQRAAPRSAGDWPLHECLVTRDWQRESQLIEIVVARRSSAGEFAAAVILVDLDCLGVKNAFTRWFPSVAEYDLFRREFASRRPMVEADLDLCAKIVHEAIEYAHRWGFNPHRDYARAEPFFAGANPEASPAHIPLGKDGKPFFISGPYDDVRTILAKLDRTAGPGNYVFLVGGPI